MEGYLALIKEQRQENEELKQQVDRLNNIINELEKFCNVRTKTLYGVVGVLWQEYQDVLDKLKELKEDNKC